jgi:hypothetical protein
MVACSFEFTFLSGLGGNGRQPAADGAVVIKGSSDAAPAPPGGITRPFATDRYLSPGERPMPPLFPVARWWDRCHFSAPHSEGRNGQCGIY